VRRGIPPIQPSTLESYGRLLLVGLGTNLRAHGLLAGSTIDQWYLPWVPVPLLASCIVLFFTFVNSCGAKGVMRLAMPIAVAAAVLAFLSATIPIFGGRVDWQRAFTFHLNVPFEVWFIARYLAQLAQPQAVG